MRSTTTRKALSAALAVLAAAALAVGLPGAASAQTQHSSGEIGAAAQSWVDRGAPYDQLTATSRQLVSRSTWSAWVRCGDATPRLTATVRGYGNDLAVVRFSYPGGGHTEWTAFYRDGRWEFALPGSAVQRVHSHTAAQLAGCE